MYSNLELPIVGGSTLRPLRASLEAAQEQARETSSRVLVSRTVVRDPRAPRPRPDHFDRYMLWEQAERGFGLMALGVADTLVAEGPKRFTDIRSQLDTLLAGALVEQDEGVPRDLPVALAGFSFDPEKSCASNWGDFPDALAFVPRMLYVRAGDDRYLTTNAVVDVYDRPECARDIDRAGPRTRDCSLRRLESSRDQPCAK